MNQENDFFEAELAEESKPLNKVFDSKGITWKQKGPYLVAKKDGVELHAYIGMHKKLIGFDGDKPLFQEC